MTEMTNWEQAVKAAEAYHRSGDKATTAVARWFAGEMLAGTPREDIAKGVAAQTYVNDAGETCKTFDGLLSASTIRSGWGAAFEHAGRAFAQVAADYPETSTAFESLTVTGAPAHRWRGTYGGTVKAGAGKAGDTWAPIALRTALDHAAHLVGAARKAGVDVDLTPLVKRSACFFGAVAALGVPVLALVDAWVATGHVGKGGDVPSAESDAAESDDDRRDEHDVVDPWGYVELAVEALARVEARAADLTPAQRATAGKTLGASMTALRSAYVAANEQVAVKA